MVAYNLAGYPTPDMGAESMITSPLFTRVNLSDIQEGDILASNGHVAIIAQVHSVRGRQAGVTILDAVGAPVHRVRLLRCNLVVASPAYLDQVRILSETEHYGSIFNIRRRNR